MVYKELRALLNLLNHIRNGVNQKDFDKVIKKLEKNQDYEQILDEWKYFIKEVKINARLL